MHFFVKTQSLRALLWQRRQYKKNPQRSRQSLVHSWGRQRRSLLQKQLYRNQALAILSPVITDAQTLLSHWFPTFRAYRYLFKGRFPLRRIRPRDQAMCYQGMRGSKSKMKASVYWRTLGQFWKLNQVQLFRDQNEWKPIGLLLFNDRACDRTGSRDQIRWSGNRP